MRRRARFGPLSIQFQRGQLRNVHLLEQLGDVSFADGVGLRLLQTTGFPFGEMVLMLAPGRLLGRWKTHGPGFRRGFQIRGSRRPLAFA